MKGFHELRGIPLLLRTCFITTCLRSTTPEVVNYECALQYLINTSYKIIISLRCYLLIPESLQVILRVLLITPACDIVHFPVGIGY